MGSVGQWLEELGVGQYQEVFERNAVDLELLRDLTETDLERLGVEAVGHRKRLLKAIATLDGKSSAQTQAPDVAQSRRAERRQLTTKFKLVEARAAIEEGLAIHTRHGMKYEAAVPRRLLAEVTASQHSDPKASLAAEVHFLTSIAALEKLEAEGDLALACAAYGRHCVAQGRSADGRELLARALCIRDRLALTGEAERVRATLSALPSR